MHDDLRAAVRLAVLRLDNHGAGLGKDPPLDAVGEIHLGGHHEDHDDQGAPLLIDSHNAEVADPVWTLYEHTISRAGAKPTLIEWDSDVPGWTELEAEAARAARVLNRAHA